MVKYSVCLSLNKETAEKRCRELFVSMKKAKIKCQLYFDCKALHDQFVKNPTDYEGFKLEYEKIADAMRTEKNKTLVQEKTRRKQYWYWDKMKKEGQEKLRSDLTCSAQTGMLYIRVVINGFSTLAFIDSGAYTSMITISMAKKAGIDHKVDTRLYKGYWGLGQRREAGGIITSCFLEIGNSQFEAKFGVWNETFDFVIGLDFLHRHKCKIDLEKLTFNDGMNVTFVSEAEVAEWEAQNIIHIAAPLRSQFTLDEIKLKELVDIKFDKAEAEKALTEYFNDVEAAVRNLYYLEEVRERKTKLHEMNMANNPGNALKYSANFPKKNKSNTKKNKPSHPTNKKVSRSATSMKLTMCAEDRVTAVEIRYDCPIETLVALAVADFGSDSLDPSKVLLLKEGIIDIAGMNGSRTLAECGLSDGDMILYALSKDESIAVIPEEREESSEEDKCRKLFKDMNRPKIRCEYYFAWKALHDQFVKNRLDYDGFKREYSAFMIAEKKKLQLMNNPHSVEGQTLVLEKICHEYLDRIEKEAKDRIPPAMNTQPRMIYIRLAVNGHDTISHVDSGAFYSTIPPSLVEKAGLESEIDTREQQKVSVVGGLRSTSGVIHLCSLKIGAATFDTKFRVLNTFPIMIIGLDFLRHYKCLIDLEKNRLSLENNNLHIDFLTDAEVAEYMSTSGATWSTDLKVDEEKVAELLDIGFPDEYARIALRNSSNDIPHAVCDLYALADEEYEKALKANEVTVELAETDMETEEADEANENPHHEKESTETKKDAKGNNQGSE